MKKVLLLMIGFYRKRISPAFPPTCKFFPTCSEYARQAVERHGAAKGAAFAVWRVLRCNPFTEGGYDPVP